LALTIEYLSLLSFVSETHRLMWCIHNRHCHYRLLHDLTACKKWVLCCGGM